MLQDQISVVDRNKKIKKKTFQAVVISFFKFYKKKLEYILSEKITQKEK